MINDIFLLTWMFSPPNRIVQVYSSNVLKVKNNDVREIIHSPKRVFILSLRYRNWK